MIVRTPAKRFALALLSALALAFVLTSCDWGQPPPPTPGVANTSTAVSPTPRVSSDLTGPTPTVREPSRGEEEDYTLEELLLLLELLEEGLYDEEPTPTIEIPIEETIAVQAQTPEPTPTSPSGERIVLADSGFRPVPNGFSFRNYGGSYPDTPAEMTGDDLRIMFGDQACARIEDGECTPTAPALQWLDRMNGNMNGGHCEGFAVMSLHLYKGSEGLDEFGGGNSTFDLTLEDNQPLIRHLAREFSMQYLEPVAGEYIESRSLTPSQVVDRLILSMEGDFEDPLTLGIYKPGYREGHAITPFAVEDRGNGIHWIWVYDNNFPGEDKYVEVDRNNETWTYSTAANPASDPSRYEGDSETQTLDLTSLSVRARPFVCPFCGQRQPGGRDNKPRHLLSDPFAMLVNDMELFNLPRARQEDDPLKQLWFDGEGHVLITDSQGRRLGFDGNTFVNEIPGAVAIPYKGGLGLTEEPVYLIPSDEEFNVTLDGRSVSGRGGDELVVFDEGVATVFDNIELGAGQQDNFTITADGRNFTYTSGGDESPDISVSVDGLDADYIIRVDDLSVGSGEEIELTFDAEGRLGISDNDPEADEYDLQIIRMDEDGSNLFRNNDLTLEEGDTDYIDFTAWTGKGDLEIGVDDDGDGAVDTMQTFADQ